MSNKIALVFGHTTGLGHALTKQFLKNGYKVIGISRSSYDAQADKLINIPTDLTNEKELNTVIASIKRNYSNFDILVFAAGH